MDHLGREVLECQRGCIMTEIFRDIVHHLTSFPQIPPLALPAALLSAAWHNYIPVGAAPRNKKKGRGGLALWYAEPNLSSPRPLPWQQVRCIRTVNDTWRWPRTMAPPTKIAHED
jgi:hypothetical protein